LGNVEIAADYKASSLLIEKLAQILGLEIDTKPLLKEAKETEKALLSHLEQLKKTGEEVKKFEDIQTPMYT
jgi:predicted ATP-grasp superfamily ATP-dependent carboligase